VALVAKGLAETGVAAELYVSTNAVEYHLGTVFAKLGITSRRELRQFARSAFSATSPRLGLARRQN
jgi:DNA-binding NarL/FixJ family response regulator